MKKFLIGLSLISAYSTMSFAQISQGGFPLKLNDNSSYIPKSTYNLPDWAAAQRNYQNDIANGIARGGLIGKAVDASFSFPNSGTFVEENGKKIWRGVINIDNAPALMCYFDKFNLPKGVNLFLSNKNGKQVLGAYTADNNDPTGLFAIEALQGGQANIELDIEQGVDVDKIQLNINKVLVLFTSISYLADYVNDSVSTIDGPSGINDGSLNSQLTNTSSKCNIDAICPLANHYEIQRNAALQVIQLVGQNGEVCSASLVNNTGNSASDCKHYILYASHCDGGTDTTAAHFAQTIFRFNYQQTTCGATTTPSGSQVYSTVGANFKARSILTLANGQINAQAIKGDFLLLEMKQALATTVGANMIGWNISASPQLSGYTYPKKFVDFNHPMGDVKKVTSFKTISSTGIAASNTHWVTTADSGLVSTGTSGSSLLDGDGKTLGVASVANGAPTAACGLTINNVDVSTSTFTNVYFSKLSYDWAYQLDAQANWNQLKPWLDPINSGVSTISPVTSSCTAITDTTGGNSGSTGIYNTPSELGNSFQVFPNPTNTGKATLSLHLKDKTDLNVQLLDITGKKLASFTLNRIQSGNFSIDLSKYANGIYFVQVADGNTISTKKLVIAK